MEPSLATQALMAAQTLGAIVPPDIAPLSQKEAIFSIITKLTDNIARGQDVTLKSLVTKEIRKELTVRLLAGIRVGAIKCKPEYDEKQLRKYCSGVISNWLKKDLRYY